MTPRIVRPVFALLVLGLAVHAVHALVGPGDGAGGQHHRQLGLHRRHVGRQRDVPARRRHAAPRAWRVGAHRPRPAFCGRAATSCGRCGSATSRTRPTRASPTASTSAATSRSTPGSWCCCAARLRPIRPAQWLDGAVGGLAAAAVVAALVFPALAGLTEGDTIDVAFNLAYPVCDVLQLTLDRHGLRPQPLARGPLVAAAGPRACSPTSSPIRPSATSRPWAATSRARGSTRCGPLGATL